MGIRIYIYQWVYQPTNQQINYKLQYYSILPYYHIISHMMPWGRVIVLNRMNGDTLIGI